MKQNRMVILLTVLITAILVGGIVWILMNMKVKAERQANNSSQQQISDLEAQVSQLKSTEPASAQAAALQTQVNDLKTKNQNLQNQVNQLQSQMSNMVIDRDGDGR